MNKILLLGKFNHTVQEMYAILSSKCNVQLGTMETDPLQGMMDIFQPELVVISVMELAEVYTKVFEVLRNQYNHIPVLVVGIESSIDKYERFFDEEQFTKLIRPISREDLLKSCYNLMKDNNPEVEKTSWGGIQPRKKKILVVDDSAVTLRSIKAMLEPKYQVLVASSGEKALKVAQNKKPDLILLDYDMPGMDGKETFEKLKEIQEVWDTPVIFLTGIADKEHITDVLAMNPAGYFLKPPKREKLLQTISINMQS